MARFDSLVVQSIFGILFSSICLFNGLALELPVASDSLVKQASKAIVAAFLEGNIHRQCVKLPLSESMYSLKEEGFVADRAIGWQGGPQETARFLSPLAIDLLKQVSISLADAGGLVAKVSGQTLLDFDGSVLLTAEHPAGALWDVQALLQPNTDSYYMQTIQSIEEQFSDTPDKPKRLFLLVNPAWRDKNSWGFFDKDKAQTKILDRYTATYTLDQFVVRGIRLSLLKVWPNDWHIFYSTMPYTSSKKPQTEVYGENGIPGAKEHKLIGTFSHRPSYQELDHLVLENLNGR